MEKMTSGEIAKKAGVSQKAIRFYDEKGLLKPSEYSEGNYRLYDENALAILEKIIALKQIGYSLEEIRDNLTSGLNRSAADSLKEQLAALEEKRDALEKSIACIKNTLARMTEESDWDEVAGHVQGIRLDQVADEQHYEALLHTEKDMDWYVRIYRSLNLREKENVLDLGCGFAKLWRNNWSEIPENVRISCYDLHGSWADDFANYLEKQKNELSQGAEILMNWMDVEAEETWEKLQKEKKYSCVIAHYLFDFIREPEVFLDRVASVLAKNGRFSCNGAEVSKWHGFAGEILSEAGVNTMFLNRIVSSEEKERNAFREMLERHFSCVESVLLPNTWEYSPEEIFEALCERYPEQLRQFQAKESEIRSVIETLKNEDGVIRFVRESQFWHCYR